MYTASRREFLGSIGHGMLLASLGSTLAGSLTAARPPRFRSQPVTDPLEALIARMQQTAPDELLPQLCTELKQGTALGTLVAAGALANARTFGGGDYDGYHAFMALLPAYHMAEQMPGPLAPLPVLKVLYRNTARIRGAGKGKQVLTPVEPAADADATPLRDRTRACDMASAERLFARTCQKNLDAAWDELQTVVDDDLNVHRTVLTWRAWDMRQLCGDAHAHTLLRQVVRFCIDEEQDRVQRGRPAPAVRTDVPAILDRCGLLKKAPGERVADDAFVDRLATTVFGESRAGAAEAVAKALAEGWAPDAIAEAIALAGNKLLLHDTGKNRVHGASVGVHASDAANAWRNIARLGQPATRLASLVVAAYHTAGQSAQVGAEPYAYSEQLAQLTAKDPGELLAAASRAIEQKDQRAACAAFQRYGDLGHAAEPAFALLLRYATSEDGALHAEKYFYTVHEEFHRARAAFRWRHVVALARVTASEFGEPAPGVAQAKQLLGA